MLPQAAKNQSGGPIYARLLVRHPELNIPPFTFNGSLAEPGVREKLAAEELIDHWTVQFLSGQNGKPDHNAFKTVEQAIEDCLNEKRGTLDAHKESTKLTIQILRPLAPFLRDRGIVGSQRLVGKDEEALRRSRH